MKICTEEIMRDEGKEGRLAGRKGRKKRVNAKLWEEIYGA